MTAKSQLILLYAFIPLLQPHRSEVCPHRIPHVRNSPAPAMRQQWSPVVYSAFNHNVVWVSHSEAILNIANQRECIEY